MFEDEFQGLPPEIRIFLQRMLEEQIRVLARQYGWGLMDPERKNFTFEAVCGKIHSVFDLASRYKRSLASSDTPDESGYV